MFNYYTINTQFGENIVINTDDGTFVIIREKNLDLYWNPVHKNYQEEDATYRITRENYYLFNVFNTLYEELIDYQIFFDNEEHLPIDGNVVNWYSDDNKKGEASLLQMYKQEDSIKIVFKKEKNDNYRIKIKNCDSKYAPANEAFMEMYNVLAYQNPRVKMEECINKKPRVLKR